MLGVADVNKLVGQACRSLAKHQQLQSMIRGKRIKSVRECEILPSTMIDPSA
jgi:hypothetical protein